MKEYKKHIIWVIFGLFCIHMVIELYFDVINISSSLILFASIFKIRNILRNFLFFLVFAFVFFVGIHAILIVLTIDDKYFSQKKR